MSTTLFSADERYVSVTLDAADLVARAHRERLAALGERQRLWKPDPAGRRARGHRYRAANQRFERAYERLLKLVWEPNNPAPERRAASPDIVTRVLAIWQANGPTPIEGARGSGTIATRRLLDELTATRDAEAVR